MVPRKNAPNKDSVFSLFILERTKNMNILLEYLIVFIIVLIINILIKRFNKNNFGDDIINPEVLYLKKIYKININKNEQETLNKIIIFINTFIISTIYIIIMYLLNNWVLRIVLGIILLILMIIICYGLLGRYYLKKEGE